MSVLTFIRELVFELGEDPDSLSIQTVFLSWISDGVQEIFSESPDWKFRERRDSFNTVASTKSYVLSSDVETINTAYNADTGVELIATSSENLTVRGFDLDQEGTPTHYYFDGYSGGAYSISLWPVPSGVNSIELLVNIDPASITIASTLDLPPVILSVLRNYVRSMYWADAGDFNKAQMIKNSYLVGLRNARRDHAFTKGRNYVMGVRDVPVRRGLGEVRLPLTYPRF